MAVAANGSARRTELGIVPPILVQFEKGESSTSSFSWLDLPDCLTENILERLDAADYVRFGAVCPQWLSVQSTHRRRYSPSAPPLVRRPWFIPCIPDGNSVPCSDPFSDGGGSRSYRLELPVPEKYFEFRRSGIIQSKYLTCFMALPDGWFLMDGRPLGEYPYPRGNHLTLFNPLLPKDQCVVLPKLERKNPLLNYEIRAAASYPGSIPAGIALLIVVQDDWARSTLQLFRTGRDQHWLPLACQEFENHHENRHVQVTMTDLAFCRGKFYARYVSSRLVVVDARSEEPEVYLLEMDVSMLPKGLPSLRLDSILTDKSQRRGDDERYLGYWYDSLVESDGQLLLVIHTYQRNGYMPTRRRVYVFAADFDTNRWVKVDSLGDRVLLVYGENQDTEFGKKHGLVVSLLAEDIGAEKNRIYVLDLNRDNKPTLWIAFDVKSGQVTRAPLGYAPPFATHLMFVPSIC